MRRPDRVHAAAAALLGGLTLTGCLCAGERSPVPFVHADAAPDASDSPPDTLEVTARDFAFDAAPRIEAGEIVVRLVNRGAVAHHAAIVALEGPGALDAFFSAMRRRASFPSPVRPAGATPSAPPGQESAVPLRLDPGEYLIVCLDTDSAGESHVMRGMVRSLVVRPSGAHTPGR